MKFHRLRADGVKKSANGELWNPMVSPFNILSIYLVYMYYILDILQVYI